MIYDLSLNRGARQVKEETGENLANLVLEELEEGTVSPMVCRLGPCIDTLLFT